jgi:nucleoside-diphosphate kinase
MEVPVTTVPAETATDTNVDVHLPPSELRPGNLTLLIFKPDTLKKGKIHVPMKMLELAGAEILKCDIVRPEKEALEEHYAEHKGKWYYDRNLAFMLSGLIMVVIIRVHDAVAVGERIKKRVREIHHTKDEKNMIHASDSDAAAMREIRIWLPYLSLKDDMESDIELFLGVPKD